MRVALLDEDEKQIAYLTHILSQIPMGEDSIVCEPFTTSTKLRSALRRETYDLLILDWNLPDVEAVDFLRWLQNFHTSAMLVVVLTARDAEQDIAKALGNGADDCVSKPIRPVEFTARVARLLRKNSQTSTASLQSFGNWVFDRTHNTAHVRDAQGEHQVVLTEREFRLAVALFQHLGVPLSRSHLLEYSGVSGEEGGSRALDSHIYRLRGKLFLGRANGIRLQTIYGHGYRLELLANPALHSPELSPAARA